MSLNQVLIILNGEEQRVLSKDSYKIVLSKKKVENINQDHTLLQCKFDSIEDLIKAEIIIKKEFSRIDEIIIINNSLDLNMISYQYDYDHIRHNYQELVNLIYFINLLIPLFNKNISFVLSFEKDNHYKIHFNNFKISFLNYLNSLKIDLIKSCNLVIKKLD